MYLGLDNFCTTLYFTSVGLSLKFEQSVSQSIGQFLMEALCVLILLHFAVYFNIVLNFNCTFYSNAPLPCSPYYVNIGGAIVLYYFVLLLSSNICHDYLFPI